MKRFWASWWSGYHADEGCTAPFFQVWISGSKGRANDGLTAELLAKANAIEDEDEYDAFIDEHAKDDVSICALIDAESEDQIWEVVAKHFPDYVVRFCEERPIDYNPGDRFGGFENRTKLKED